MARGTRDEAGGTQAEATQGGTQAPTGRDVRAEYRMRGQRLDDNEAELTQPTNSKLKDEVEGFNELFKVSREHSDAHETARNSAIDSRCILKASRLGTVQSSNLNNSTPLEFVRAIKRRYGNIPNMPETPVSPLRARPALRVCTHAWHAPWLPFTGRSASSGRARAGDDGGRVGQDSRLDQLGRALSAGLQRVLRRACVGCAVGREPRRGRRERAQEGRAAHQGRHRGGGASFLRPSLPLAAPASSSPLPTRLACTARPRPQVRPQELTARDVNSVTEATQKRRCDAMRTMIDKAEKRAAAAGGAYAGLNFYHVVLNPEKDVGFGARGRGLAAPPAAMHPAASSCGRARLYMAPRTVAAPTRGATPPSALPHTPETHTRARPPRARTHARLPPPSQPPPLPPLFPPAPNGRRPGVRPAGQTIENMFDFSFHLKEGHVSISLGEDGEPMVHIARPPCSDEYQTGLSKVQNILKLDYPTWERLCVRYGAGRLLPTRKKGGLPPPEAAAAGSGSGSGGSKRAKK